MLEMHSQTPSETRSQPMLEMHSQTASEKHSQTLSTTRSLTPSKTRIQAPPETRSRSILAQAPPQEFYGGAKRHIALRRFTPGGRPIPICGIDRRKCDDSHLQRALQPEVSPETRRCHSR
jgi:hypothetical protein